jgi:hypothetical protein
MIKDIRSEVGVQWTVHHWVNGIISVHTFTLKFVVLFLLQYWKSKAIAINNAFFDEFFGEISMQILLSCDRAS